MTPLNSLDQMLLVLKTAQPSPIRDERAVTQAEEHVRQQANKFVDRATALDPFFWKWGLTYLLALTTGTSFLDAHWRQMNEAAQAATLETARAEEIETAAGLQRSGRYTVQLDGGTEAGKAAVVPTPITSLLRGATVASSAFTPEDAHASCAVHTRELAARAEGYGASFRCGDAATRLLLEGGRAVGVRTAAGDEVRADAVVVCAGARSAPLLSTAGVYAPVQPLRGYSLTCDVRPEAAESGLLPSSHVVCKPFQLYITPMSGQLRFTCFGELTPCRDEDANGPPTAALHERLVSLVEHAVPTVRELCSWSDATPWHGSRPLTPDCTALVGPTRVAGLFVNTGHGFNGWRDTQLTARHLAATVRGMLSDASSLEEAYAMRRFQPVQWLRKPAAEPGARVVTQS